MYLSSGFNYKPAQLVQYVLCIFADVHPQCWKEINGKYLNLHLKVMQKKVRVKIYDEHKQNSTFWQFCFVICIFDHICII